MIKTKGQGGFSRRRTAGRLEKLGDVARAPAVQADHHFAPTVSRLFERIRFCLKGSRTLVSKWLVHMMRPRQPQTNVPILPLTTLKLHRRMV